MIRTVLPLVLLSQLLPSMAMAQEAPNPEEQEAPNPEEQEAPNPEEIVRRAQAQAALDPFLALRTIEDAAYLPQATDRRWSDPLIRGARSLPVPGAEPEWLIAGGVSGALGLATLVITATAHVFSNSCLNFGSASCGGGSQDDTGFYIAYGIGGAAAVTGIVLLFVGLVLHTLDPERRMFVSARRDVVRLLRNVQSGRGIEIAWP